MIIFKLIIIELTNIHMQNYKILYLKLIQNGLVNYFCVYEQDFL